VGTAGIDRQVGNVRIQVPAGAFSSDVTITVIEGSVTPPAGLIPVGPAYEIETGGREPARPVVLTLTINPGQLGSLDLRKLGIYRQDGSSPGNWVYVGGAIDPATGRVTVTLTGFSRYAVMYKEQSFADLAGHWSRTDVEVLISRQLVNGVSATAFEPDRNITRAELAKLLVSMLALDPTSGVKLEAPATPSFKDVAPDAWYYIYVETAARHGLVKGSAGQFRPNDPVTRQEMAAMLLRALGLEEASQTAATNFTFSDANSIADWARGYVALAVQTGLMRGLTATEFGPEAFATRAQAAVVVLRAMIQRGDVIIYKEQ
jgi:hypothetical protein